MDIPHNIVSFFPEKLEKNSREIQKDDGRQIVVFSIYS